ncbi:MAG: glycine betaine/L-proline ABC transporter ATP-binding protein [Chloroflexota bacterium]|nr:glycine betaine/L-proline ABC transporter ATP-binding protein [Chloroflexota bacterium]MDE2885929.1 glycine betaine/L-proline ABC transporter ATP-binding protein [Chloroflexota bacterium]
MAASNNGTQPKVSVRGLWKVFGLGVPTELTEELLEKSKSELREEAGWVVGLRDVNFDVRTGETFVVMGLSGSGKSTLVRTLLRLIEPTFGAIEVDGEDILVYSDEQLTEYRRTKTAMVFQHFGLLPHRTVEENAAWGLEVRGIEREARMERAHEVLDLVGLTGWEQYRPNALSGGMQQRVGLARALAADPDVLLMDEPFSGLDPLIRRDMQNELLRLQQQMHKTIIFITHDLSEALKLGDHIAIMRDGSVIQMGTGEEILANPADDYVAEFVRDVRKSSVVTLRSIMEPVLVKLHADMSPKQAMDALGEMGEVCGFVADKHETYVGAVSFAKLAEAKQSDRADCTEVLLDDVTPLSEDMSVSAALPLVRHMSGPQPLIDTDGRLIGQIAPRAVIEMMERESAAEAEVSAATSAIGIGADAS